MKIGKSAAFLVGSSIILVQVANEQGWIKVDWNKVTRGIDRVGDRVEEAVTGDGPRWMDKVSSNCFYLRLVFVVFFASVPVYTLKQLVRSSFFCSLCLWHIPTIHHCAFYGYTHITPTTKTCTTS